MEHAESDARLRVQFVHGLESSPQSTKARLFARHFDARTPPMDTADFEGCVALQAREAQRFGPDVLVGSSFGGAVALAMLQRGLWRGPTLLLAQAGLKMGLPTELPSAVRIHIVHGARDDIVHPEDSRRLTAAGNAPWVTLDVVDDDHPLRASAQNEALVNWVRTTGAACGQPDDRAFRLRPLRASDEAQARRAHHAMALEDFPFLFDFDPGGDFAAYVERCDRFNRGTTPFTNGGVNGQFFLGVAGDRIVGRLSLRYALNDRLRIDGGHIGYCVLPEHRRRGFATRMLADGLEHLAGIGIDSVLLTCDESNSASRAVIEAAAPSASRRVTAPSGTVKRHYTFAATPRQRR